jgi:methylase of polypeptide subunit release factors
MRDILEIEKFTYGIFPWNEYLGREFTERAKKYKADTVMDLFAGTGHLGVEVANKINASRVILIEINPASCHKAMSLWKNYNRKKVYVVQADILRNPPSPHFNGVVVSNPPHAPLPDSFSTWQNAYGGDDGLLFVRAMFEWLLKCKRRVSFLIAGYFLTNKIDITIEDVIKKIDRGDPGVESIYHFKEPSWKWIGIKENTNPALSEKVFSWYLDYCQEYEKVNFLSLLRNNPYVHHILIEGTNSTIK